LKVSLARN